MKVMQSRNLDAISEEGTDGKQASSSSSSGAFSAIKIGKKLNTKESLATGKEEKETQFTKQTNAEEENDASRSNTKSMLLEDDIDAGAINKIDSVFHHHQDVVRH